MQVAVAGLGRMGAGMARRAARGGHDVVVWNRTESVATEVAAEEENKGHVTVAEPLDRLIEMVEAPRHVIIRLRTTRPRDGVKKWQSRLSMASSRGRRSSAESTSWPMR